LEEAADEDAAEEGGACLLLQAVRNRTAIVDSRRRSFIEEQL
jgi:hypothetical protein